MRYKPTQRRRKTTTQAASIFPEILVMGSVDALSDDSELSDFPDCPDKSEISEVSELSECSDDSDLAALWPRVQTT